MKKITLITIVILALAYNTLAFSGGDGSLGNPYQISNCTELQDVKNYLSSNFILISDINFDTDPGCSVYTTGSGFEPIGTVFSLAGMFKGSFDGQGHNITGLFVNNITSDYTGLFGLVGQSTSVIKNVVLVDPEIIGFQNVGGLVGHFDKWTSNSQGIRNVVVYNVSVTGARYIGGLVGYPQYVDEIFNTSVIGGVVNGTEYQIGGLIGYGNQVVINKSKSTADIYCTESSCLYRAGGLFGAIANSNILDSYSTGDVTTTSTADEIGGLVGYIQSTNIINSYASGNVIGDSYVGGLIGFHNSGVVNINYTYSTGAVTGNTNVGGFIGSLTTSGIIADSYWDTATSGLSNMCGSVGGTGCNNSKGKTTSQMKQQSTYLGWNFTNIWAINESNEYPYLIALGPTKSGILSGPIYSNFDGSTTNYDSCLFSCSNAILENSTYGSIQWSGTIDASTSDFNSYATISDQLVSIDSANLDSSINSTATIIMEGVDCVNFNPSQLLYKDGFFTTKFTDGQTCDFCTINSCTGTTLNFTTPHFTGYQYGANANLTIYDQDEGSPYNCAGDITFYANYTNSSAHIPTATCSITISSANITNQPMTDNGANYNYNLSADSFLSTGIFDWNVSCDKIGYDLLMTNDTIEIGTCNLGGDPAIPEFSTVGIALALIIIVLGVAIIKRK